MSVHEYVLSNDQTYELTLLLIIGIRIPNANDSANRLCLSPL